MALNALIYHLFGVRKMGLRRRLLGGRGFWPDDAHSLPLSKVLNMYDEGYAGAYLDDDATEDLDNEIKKVSKFKSGDEMLHTMKLPTGQAYAGSSEGQFLVLHPVVVEYYGFEGLTRPGQATGDCVSMQMRDVTLYLTCLDAASKTPDAVTGKVEQPPQVSDLARRNGIFCNEFYYLSRGHNGQGMACDTALAYAMKKGGTVIRKQYDQANLEAYNVKFELRGSAGTPAWGDQEGSTHRIRDAIRLNGWEAVADFMWTTKCPIGNCSSLGFSSSRDQYGFTKQRGSWGHSWHTVGIDRRPWVQKAYGCPGLALSGHRWGPWNSGGREIYDSARFVPTDRKIQWQQLGLLAPSGNMLIPEGYWWHDIRLLSKNWTTGVNSITGWAARELPQVVTVLG